MVSTVQIVCTGRKIISQLLKIDGSFFVPYFTLISLSDFSNKDRCTACLYGMVSRIIMLSFSTALPRCFPKASAKVVLFFISANYLEIFFEKSREKIKHTGKICAIKLFPGLNPTKKTLIELLFLKWQI
jgi:hypothetical protein